jgi:hypothetical protein
LNALGSPLLQGYYFMRPAPLPDVMSWAVSLAAAGVAAGAASGAVAATAAAAPANAA